MFLGNYSEAKADLELALKITPHDLIMKEELKFVDDKIKYGDVYRRLNKSKDMNSNEVSQFHND